MLELNRTYFEQKRYTFKTDKEFAESIWLSTSAIAKNMWPRWERPKKYKNFDIQDANERRKFAGDTNVAKSIWISVSVLINRCWTRDSIWLGRYNWSNSANWSKPKKKKEEKKGLNTESWSYPEQTDYELSWKSEAIDLNLPHPALYEHKKCTSCSW